MTGGVGVSRPAGAREIWNARTVAWYRRALARSDYAERVLGAVASLVADCATALDVGAGCGALALPLARRGLAVTAIEPAPAMAAALREAARDVGPGRVTVIEAAWEDVTVAPHDLVLCAHVRQLLEPGSSFLPAAATLARRGVVLVRDAPGGDDKFFFSELYPVLLGRMYGREGSYADTLEALARLGVAPTVTPVEYRSDQPFTSLEEACDFWMEYMGLTGTDARDYLRRFLAARLRREGPWWVAPLRRRAVVIHWRTA